MGSAPTPHVLTNLRAGAALAFGLTVGRFSFRPGLHQAAALIAGFAILMVAAEFALVEPPIGFNTYSLTILAAYVVALLAGAYAVTCLQRTPTLFGLLAVALLSAGLAPALISTVAFNLVQQHVPRDSAEMAGAAVGWAFAAWSGAIAYRAMRLLLGTDGAHGVVLATAFALCAVPPHLWEPAPEVWYTVDRRSDRASWPRPDVEATYYAQARLMADQVAALRPSDPGATNLYFLGLAGYAHEPLFMKEVQAARALFDRRYGTEGRSMTLVNNMATVSTAPLANLPNLRAALSGIAAKMNTERDVLFLFLSSHGDPDIFYADFWPLDVNDISSADLADALDGAGIKWRVIVIAACSSGSFIEALRDDHTLVIADAAHDRDSFFGSADATYSYFGQAYFGEALRQQHSFISAFALAREAVLRRERVAGLPASEPQMAVGAAIPDKLQELEGRLTAWQ